MIFSFCTFVDTLFFLSTMLHVVHCKKSKANILASWCWLDSWVVGEGETAKLSLQMTQRASIREHKWR